MVAGSVGRFRLVRLGGLLVVGVSGVVGVLFEICIVCVSVFVSALTDRAALPCGLWVVDLRVDGLRFGWGAGSFSGWCPWWCGLWCWLSCVGRMVDALVPDGR